MATRAVRAAGLPPLAAAVVASLVFVLAHVGYDRFPFGPRTRGINDLGTQLVPMHALYRDVLTGEAAGDLWFNWNSALGVPFLPDLVTYLASPLSTLVVLFPRDRVDLAVFVIHGLHLALAAAVMTAYLRRLSPGPPAPAVALGAAYATCGWAMDDAGYLTSWLPGLVAFPLLALVGEWAIKGDRGALGPALVGLAWCANFYTAYMATIGAAVLLLTRLVDLSLGWRESVVALGRLARTAAIGIALAAPLLVPLLRANAFAVPAGDTDLARTHLVAVLPADPAAVVSRLLPATEDVGLTPGLYVTTPVVLLAVMFVWSRGVAPWRRLLYAGVLAALVLSLFWFPTHFVWHGFDAPQGSPYRQAFVVAGWITVLAWFTLSRSRPALLAVAGGAVTVLLAFAVGAGSAPTSAWTGPLLALGLTVSVVALVLRSVRSLPWTAVGGALVLLVLVESTLTAITVAAGHQQFGKQPPWGAEHQAVRAAIVAADAWPNTRTTPGSPPIVDPSWNSATRNDPMLLGGQGIGYYSSLMPLVTSEALQALGVTYSGWGRSIMDLPDPVRDAVLGIGQRVDRSDADAIHVDENLAAPLVTARELPDAGDNAFLNRNELAGAPAYVLPETEVTTGAGEPLAPGARGYRLPPSLDSPAAVLEATCPPGTTVHLWAPVLTGSAQLEDRPPVEVLPVGARRPGLVVERGPVDLGPAPPGAFRVAVRGEVVVLPPRPLACLDAEVLRAGIESLRERGADVDAGGHGFTARWDAPVAGDALALVPAVPGWRCGTGTDLAPPDSAAGFITHPMAGASELTCAYRPPGLRLGLAIGALAAAGLLLTAAAQRRARWGAPSRRSAARR